MLNTTSMTATLQNAGAACRIGELIAIQPDGTPVVCFMELQQTQIVAQLLNQQCLPQIGDRVLILMCDDIPVILGGLLSSYPRSDTSAEREQLASSSKHVHLEATEDVALRCGKSSLTLRKDGRIVIKGTEIVSRATRSNRIKGGTVNIN